MRDRVTGCVATIRRDCIESSHRFITPVHPRVSDRQAKRWSATEILRLFVERDRVIEATHLAIKCRQQRLAINKYRIKLQCSLARRDRFIKQTEIAVEFACEIVHPERCWIDLGSALQISECFIAFTARSPKLSRKII